MTEEAQRAGTLRDGIAVVTVDNPPMGVLTVPVRTALLAAVEAADADPACRAIVIAGSGGAFAMGTGLDAGGEAEAPGPDLATIFDRIEACGKPVVAAITGPALGNGLELALAAHARVTSPSARLGAPEITIGLVPGAGGTQRLPKVVGGIAALKMLLSGRSVNGTSAARLGLVDRLVETDVTEAAIALAREMAESGAPPPRSSQRRDRLGEGTSFLEAVAVHRRIAEASPLDAPLRLIECVEAALLLPYETGRGLEAVAFEDLVASDHSRALRHVFAVERRLATNSRTEGRVPSRPLSLVGFLGARGIGAEIAVACLDAGFSVTVAEQSDELLESGVTRIIEQYDARVASGHMREEQVETTLDRLNAVCGYRTLAEADVVIDPGPGASKAMVSEIDGVMKAGAVLATGAETVDVATIAAATRRPGDVVGLKFYPGMRDNRLTEIVVSDVTAPRALATVRALARKLDRLVVQSGPGPAPIGTQVAEALHAAADLCVLEGAGIGQVDAVLEDWGIPLGSFAWRDLRGLAQARGKGRGDTLGALMAEHGRLGRANGRGFYLYRNRSRRGAEDPDSARLIADERKRRGIAPAGLDDGAIRVRCLAAMAGAGAAMLADGTARSPSDIDMVAIHGLGFARRTGGVMFAADLIGLERVRDILTELAGRDSRIPAPSPVLLDLIRAGQGFAALDS